MKFKTVRDGQRAIILNHLGEGRIIEGPQRVFLFRERFKFLRPNTADRFQYVEIQENNGSIIHRHGPCQVFNNPLTYSEVKCQEAQCVDANHMLVVYRRLKGGHSQRRIVKGPALFIPEAEEWVHEFVWHGTDPENKTRMVPGLNRFHRLPTIAENFYYNVREVRTNDDTMLTVKVMLFYEMVDVLKMLDTSHDPIADLINALCADVISFVGPLTYKKFVSCTDHLSRLETYPQLCQRAQRVGFTVQKVVFRGYHASDQLQAMQNSAIESRTELRLEREIQSQQQELTDFLLKKQRERSTLEQGMQVRRQAHQQRVEKLRQDHRLAMEEMRLQQRLQLSSLETTADLEMRRQKDEHRTDHLKALAQVEVDLTRYLNLHNDTAPAEEIRVVAPATSAGSSL
ncbi:uncharacterized protein LOC101861588 [Aplysia californica]|uniref:Uncharacterized protein LOC101861588 n=1 Tax=Aplysia californica TaxID=6500 RepID=A0ABM0JS11_APLCA|nr:uncharacterized protein LOC101861588 [Aplysia californica]XP_035826108.1 uncharacterized protein LOC101861588 [Aplysia californica]